MKINTRKVKTRNGIGREILSFEGVLTCGSLPTKYRQGLPRLFRKYLENGIIVEIKSEKTRCFNAGDILSEDEFQNALGHIRACGCRLAEINEQIRKDQENWEGLETFFI